MTEILKPLGGHSVFLLLVQLALLLIAARTGAELAKRAGLPAVIGELVAGIVLGPTVFGHCGPDAFAAVFPPDQAQHNLLEIVGVLGMVLLLLLTGLETDIRLLKNLGRAALIASGGGMFVPFALGFGLGMVMPDAYLADPDRRMLYSLFLATAMSISAMPVIAKILMDLDLTRRNIGLVILSAGVVDDTAGWLILSLIAGAASHGTVRVGELMQTLALTAAFLAAAALVLFPALRWLVRMASTRFRTRDADLVVIVVATFLCAAATEWIGVHAVFGAFIAGVILHQVPRLDPATVHRLESFVMSILAPVFFGIVGIKVDLWHLGGGWMLLAVFAVACAGKLVGCTGGALWGGMRFWEAMSIAVAMNARGAMGLVAATIGLSLGILNQQMFSIIVVVSITTSVLAPLGLRFTMRYVRITDEEARRKLVAESRGVFDPARVRLLVPTAAGPNALEASRLALAIAKRSENSVDVLYIDQRSTRWERWLSLVRPGPAGQGLESHIEDIKKLGDGKSPSIRTVVGHDVPQTIIEHAGKGYDMILIGASMRGTTLGGRVLEAVIESAPCHVAIVRSGEKPGPYRRLLVPIDGSVMSRVAVELAVRYAEVVGAELTLAVLTERRPQAAAYTDEDTGQHAIAAPTTEAELERVSRVFRASDVKPTILHLDYDPSKSALTDEVTRGGYDMVMVGAENRAIQHSLFFGYETERLLRTTPAGVVIVVPNIAQLK